MKRYFFLSLFTHIAFFILALSSTGSLPDKSERRKDDTNYGVNVIERNKKDLSYQMDIDVKGDFKKKKEDDKKCEKFYGGIGIEEDFYSNKVTKVYVGYPAEAAGILVGDLIESVSGEFIRGEPGTSIQLRITRGDKSFVITITRQEICYSI